MKFFRKEKLIRQISLIPILGLSLTAGCAVLLPSDPPAVYDLTSSQISTDVQGSTNSQILINEPKVITSLNNDRIVIKPSQSEISFFGDVQWSDRLPRLVQLYLSRAFQQTNGARAVGLPGDGLIIDHQLLFDLRAFQVEASGNGFDAHIELDVRILNDKNGRVIASQTFAAKRPTNDNPVAAVQALNEVLEEVAQELINWVYQRI